MNLKTLWQPSSNDHAPLLILLHGYGSRAEDLHALAPYFPQLNVLTLEAPLQVGPNSYAWYLLQEPRLIAPTDALNTAAIAIHETALAYQIKAKSQSMHLLGFSQGGVLAQYVAFQNPALYQSIAVLSSFWPTNQNIPPIPGQKIFWAHGAKDSVIPLSIAEQHRLALERQGAIVEAHTYAMGHTVCEEELQNLIRFLKKL